jgi:hypothetical protein
MRRVSQSSSEESRVLRIHRRSRIQDLVRQNTLVQTALEGDERRFLGASQIQSERSLSLEIGWFEGRFTGLPDNRPAIARLCVARRPPVQALITFDSWASDLDRCGPVWNGVLSTLELADRVPDPAIGPTIT